MPYFDRFDICAAYWLLEAHYNKGGILWERPTCRRRMQSVGWQLSRMRYRPGAGVLNGNISENAQAIYDAAVHRLGL